MRARAPITAIAVLSACQGLLELDQPRSGGGADGGSLDAAVSEIGASDAGPDVDGGRWCDSLDARPALCVDFDRPPLPNVCTVLETPGDSGVTFTPDPGSFTSAPYSGLASVPAILVSNEAAHARMCADLPLSRNNVSFSFDMFVEQAYSNVPIGLAALRFLGTAATGALYTAIDLEAPSGWTLQTWIFNDADSGTARTLEHPIELVNWVRVRFEATLQSRIAPTSGSLTLWVNDVLEATAPLQAPFGVDVVQVCLGVVYAEAPTGPLMVRYDNMTFDMK